MGFILYIPNALSKNATNPNDRCIKVYGGIFKDEDFSFTITNQWEIKFSKQHHYKKWKQPVGQV
jgi:hypothetical protein